VFGALRFSLTITAFPHIFFFFPSRLVFSRSILPFYLLESYDYLPLLPAPVGNHRTVDFSPTFGEAYVHSSGIPPQLISDPLTCRKAAARDNSFPPSLCFFFLTPFSSLSFSSVVLLCPFWATPSFSHVPPRRCDARKSLLPSPQVAYFPFALGVCIPGISLSTDSGSLSRHSRQSPFLSSTIPPSG